MKRAPAIPLEFTWETRTPRVIFARGARTQAGTEVARLGVERVLLISTPGRAEAAEALRKTLGAKAAGLFNAAREHVPADTLAAARSAAAATAADAYLTVGGGSAIGLAKALALDSSVPIICLPTTYSGSEMTPVWGMTDDRRKVTGRDERVLPRVVIYDPELTVGLPPGVAAASAMNALAHCVEALYAPDANPITSLVAEEGVRVFAEWLPRLAGVSKTEYLSLHGALLYGAFLGGSALSTATMGVHHRVCHLLGGTFGLPHAATHAVMLPHVVAFKERQDGQAAKVAAALGTQSASGGLRALAVAAGAPVSLREIGLAHSSLDEAVSLTAQQADGGRRLGTAVATRLLKAAFDGAPPA